jgi:hypothetical protein
MSDGIIYSASAVDDDIAGAEPSRLVIRRLRPSAFQETRTMRSTAATSTGTVLARVLQRLTQPGPRLSHRQELLWTAQVIRHLRQMSRP